MFLFIGISMPTLSSAIPSLKNFDSPISVINVPPTGNI